MWLMRCPLICNWAVEFHLPHRVMRQFGLFQAHPAVWVDTDQSLHGLDTNFIVLFSLQHGDTDRLYLSYMQVGQKKTEEGEEMGRIPQAICHRLRDLRGEG